MDSELYLTIICNYPFDLITGIDLFKFLWIIISKDALYVNFRSLSNSRALGSTSSESTVGIQVGY